MESQSAPACFDYCFETHFDDMDALWVMHHSRYLVHLERAVMALFYEAMGAEHFDPERYPDLYQVVRNVDISYLQPIARVQRYRVRLLVERLREAGLTLRFGFFDAAGKLCHARGVRTSCKLSGKTHTPVGWSEAFRQAYECREEAARAMSAQEREQCGLY